ncbi:MAG: hypothetical protein ABUS48_02490 [Pseudomonadota bacterium]
MAYLGPHESRWLTGLAIASALPIVAVVAYPLTQERIRMALFDHDRVLHGNEQLLGVKLGMRTAQARQVLDEHGLELIQSAEFRHYPSNWSYNCSTDAARAGDVVSEYWDKAHGSGATIGGACIIERQGRVISMTASFAFNSI